MSWLDGLFSYSDHSQALTDEEIGANALEKFWIASTAYPAFRLTNYEGMLSLIAETPEKQRIFIKWLGTAIRSSEMPDYQVDEAMRELALVAQGRVPTQDSFFETLKKRVVVFTPKDIATQVLPDAVKASGAQLASGFSDVSDALGDTFKSINTLGPIVIVGALLLIVYGRSRQLSGL